jgi:predicted Zn finger-like uncharacterized protein
MQFICNKCKAKYEIPADRIKGRIMRIRCRECGNAIEIRGDALMPHAEAAVPRPEKKVDAKPALKSPPSSLLQSRFKESFTSSKPRHASSTTPAKTVATGGVPTKADKLLELAHKAEARAIEMREIDRWYVAIKSSPVGPVNKTKIRSYIRRGDLGQSSLVWREGFNDWKPLRTVPELSAIFIEIQNEIKKPEQIDIAARLRRAAAQGGGTGPAANAAAAPAAPRKQYAVQPGKGSLIELEPVEVSMSQPPPASAAPRAPETEESVIDEALRGYYVGRIDSPGTLPGMDAFRPSYAAEYMPMAGAPFEAEESLSYRLLHSRLFLFIGGAGALLAGFAIMIAVLHFTVVKKKKIDMSHVVAEKEEKPVETGGSQQEAKQGDILAGLIITVEEAMEAEAASEQENPGEENPGASKKKSVKKDTSYKTTVMQMPDVEEHSVSQSVLKKKIEEESSSGGGKAKNGLADDDIRSAVTKNSKTIQRCYEKVLGKGMGVNEKIRVKVQVKVGTSGKVTKVKVIEITKYGNFLTPCIENGIQTWVFPRADAPSEFIFPVLLTPKT